MEQWTAAALLKLGRQRRGKGHSIQTEKARHVLEKGQSMEAPILENYARGMELLVVLHHFQLENIDHIYIRTAEQDGSVWLCGKFSAITKDVNVGKRHMHGHGAQFSPICIKVKGIPNLMAVVAAHGAFSVR